MSYAIVRALFERVQGLDDAARDAVFDAEAVDADIRAEVEALLASAETAGTAPRPNADPIADRIGRAAAVAVDAARPERIGKWRVTGTIGEGGMGTVLLGERDDGEYAMKAAIKVIRGHASADARERFRRERQVLAALDHPNIAKLLDGGSTANGEPFLVMAYVDGETMPAWAQRTNPTLQRRVEVLARLAHAVAHAHAHLVVHRDLKPSNVMIRADGAPVLLDFGIAKLLDDSIAGDATASRVMTPRYASPEQLLGRPVTTATDVFGLGALGYELLAGAFPERGDAMAAATVELPPPSKVALATPERARDARRLRGDLDKILRRAVRSDPRARYTSAQQFASDLDAWLDGRPVQAAGTDAWYVFSRFIARHRVAAAAVVLAVIASIAFGISLANERDRARAAEARAVREAGVSREVTGFLVDLFAEVDPELHPGRPLAARELLDIGRTRVEALGDDAAAARTRLRASLGWIYANIVDPQSATALLEAALRDLPPEPSPERVRAETALARSHSHAKRIDDSLAAGERAAALARALEPADPLLLAHALMTLGVAQQHAVRFDEAARSYDEAQRQFTIAGSTIELASVLHNRAWLADSRGDCAAAIPLYEDAVARKNAALGPDHPKTLRSLQGRAKCLAAVGRYAEAAVAGEDLLARTERVHGSDTHATETALNDLGGTYQDLGRYAEAQRHYERAVAISHRLAAGAPNLPEASTINNLGTLLEDRGDLPAALARYAESLDMRRRALPAGHPSLATPMHNRARVRLARGELDDAATDIAEALAIRREKLGASHPLTLSSTLVSAQVDAARGRSDEASAQLRGVQETIAAGTAPPAPLAIAVAEAAAVLASADGQADLMIAERRRALDLGTKLYAAGHPKLAQLKLALAEGLAARGDRSEAAKWLAEASPILRAQTVADAPVRARVAALERRLDG